MNTDRQEAKRIFYKLREHLTQDEVKDLEDYFIQLGIKAIAREYYIVFFAGVIIGLLLGTLL